MSVMFDRNWECNLSLNDQWDPFGPKVVRIKINKSWMYLQILPKCRPCCPENKRQLFVQIQGEPIGLWWQNHCVLYRIREREPNSFHHNPRPWFCGHRNMLLTVCHRNHRQDDVQCLYAECWYVEMDAKKQWDCEK